MVKTKTITSVMCMSEFSSNSSTDADTKIGKRSKHEYMRIARELYGNKGVHLMMSAKTDHEASRILHDLRMSY